MAEGHLPHAGATPARSLFNQHRHLLIISLTLGFAMMAARQASWVQLNNPNVDGGASGRRGARRSQVLAQRSAAAIGYNPDTPAAAAAHLQRPPMQGGAAPGMLAGCPLCNCSAGAARRVAWAPPRSSVSSSHDHIPCTYVEVARRSGTGIQNALKAWAYAESLGERFCGICGKSGFMSDRDNAEQDDEQRKLLRVLGLHDVVPIQPVGCPIDNGKDDGPYRQTVLRSCGGCKWKGLNWGQLVDEQQDKYFTVDWLEQARALTPPRPPKLTYMPMHKIVIHVRRGDVTDANRW